MKINLTLKNKLMIISVCLCVIPILIIGGVSVKKFHSFTQKTIEKSFNSLEDQAYSLIRTGLSADIEKINPLLIRAEKLVAAFANSPSFVRFTNAEERAIALAKNIANQKIDGLIKACNIQYEMTSEKLDQGLYAIEFIAQEKKGSIYLSTNEFFPWSSINPYTDEVNEILVPAIYVGVEKIDKVYSYEDQFAPIVDDVQEMTGVNSAIFQFVNENKELLRISTNIQTIDGTRAIGVLVPELDENGLPNPIIAALKKEGEYKGLTCENDEEYFSIYKTMYNDSGFMIGALYVGVPSKDKNLNQTIEQSKVSPDGTTFVLNSDGTIIFHSKDEYKGQNIVSDFKIEAFTELLENKSEKDVNFLFYRFNNLLHFTAYIYFKPRDWIICVSDVIEKFVEKEKIKAHEVLKKEVQNIYQSSIILIKNKSYQVFNNIRLINPKGKELLSYCKGAFHNDLQNRSEDQWFKESLYIEKGNFKNYGVLISEVSGEEILRIASPIYDNDQFTGIIVFDFDWKLVKRIHLSRVYARTGYSFIVNEKGIIVSHPEFSVKDHKNLCNPMYGQLADITRQQMINGKTGQKRFQRNGVDYLIHYIPLHTSQIKYSIAATGPVKEFLYIANRIKEDSQQELKGIMRFILLSIIFCIIISMVIGFIVSKSISIPIEKSIDFASKVSQGDLSQTLKSKNKDEVGYLLSAINTIVLTFRKIVKEVTSNSEKMGSSSESMVDIAGKLSLHSEKVSEQTGSVTETSEAMTKNISMIAKKIEDVDHSVKTISKNTETVSTNIDLMSDAIKSMSSAMTEVGENAHNGHELAANAVEMANKTGETMSQLSIAADEIGGVTQVIKRLAYKTNLIAINASIEASSAGDAGRGFQVLAKNIQDFAEQSNRAAEDIAMRISSVQENVSKAIEDITGFSNIIKDINFSSDTIVSSVEEQIQAADEISSNALVANDSLQKIVQSMSNLLRDSNDISFNISNISIGAVDVSQSIKNVSQATQDSHKSIKEVNLSALELDRLAIDLEKVVCDFKTK
ncbi:methyl-accepting chemotaxis protein [Candidatus Magnetomorum sp. HK-1]|nr:methyl-accepting chemotaxis protein [Candidatus Magnetomorum sp. HK-1]